MAPKRTTEASELPTLRKVIPLLPAEEEEVEMLREDLRRMGCAGLLSVPWGFREEGMVGELIGEPPNQYHQTIRAHPETWTKKTWQRVYGFRKGGFGLTSRKDEYAKDQFAGKIDSKEGYCVADCRDSRARAVLAFLIPVFYPEKPTRVTVTWANTIFGSFQGKREADWSQLMSELISKLLKSLPKAKSTPLSSYLAHLYHQEELLSPEEVRSWTAQDKIWSYGDTESDAGSGESEADQPESSPIRPSQQTPVAPTRTGVKRKSTPRTPEGETRGTRPRLAEADLLDDPESPCARIIVAAREVHHHISIRENMLERISDLVGCATRSRLVECVEAALTNSNRIRELEETERRLTKEKATLLEQSRVQDERVRQATASATASARAIVEVREALAIPADVVNKARLFEDRLSKEEHLSRNKIIRFLVDQATSMERCLEEMRTLADNMLLDEDPSPGKGKGKVPDSQPGPSPIPHVAKEPEAGPSSRAGKLKRKTVLLSDSEPDEEPEGTATGGEESGRGRETEPDAEEETGTPRPVFKTPMSRPRYKSTPLGMKSTPTGEAGGSSAGPSQLGRASVPVTTGTPSPRSSVTPGQTSTPPSSGQRHKLRSHSHTP